MQTTGRCGPPAQTMRAGGAAPTAQSSARSRAPRRRTWSPGVCGSTPPPGMLPRALAGSCPLCTRSLACCMAGRWGWWAPEASHVCLLAARPALHTDMQASTLDFKEWRWVSTLELRVYWARAQADAQPAAGRLGVWGLQGDERPDP
jgi:hypothetical protein